MGTREREFQSFLDTILYAYVAEGRFDLAGELHKLWFWQSGRKAEIREQFRKYRELEDAALARDESKLRELMPGSPVWERIDA